MNIHLALISSSKLADYLTTARGYMATSERHYPIMVVWMHFRIIKYMMTFIDL